ncbi:hypothetical protein [Carboxydothermus hydrogenoformans]|uniref:Uncharacterized protein n=1 Tax=Carboxydothermus hydrogenoformans (strain ATCC BAA-161 / DSM 6008 / Z-2901) TaxID=246194 RepID=Q3A9C8_CARHZ|nr:hypothetical protein [Carboxydothermus hydrogenoformans]ABB13905.1 hypothetical protein CHY_2462 [Carboxydothermus hydrogenoformans Z-2901]
MEINNHSFQNSWQKVLFPYFSYAFYFLGMGLISGSIVHMPLNPARYSLIMSIGIVLFVIASYLYEVKLNRRELSGTETVKFLLFSLFLSVGIGMMSGGIQHFDEEPAYASYLIPAGLVISLISFTVKHGIKPKLKEKLIAGVVILTLAFASWTYLQDLAKNPEVITHGHQEAEQHMD